MESDKKLKRERRERAGAGARNRVPGVCGLGDRGGESGGKKS